MGGKILSIFHTHITYKDNDNGKTVFWITLMYECTTLKFRVNHVLWKFWAKKVKRNNYATMFIPQPSPEDQTAWVYIFVLQLSHQIQCMPPQKDDTLKSATKYRNEITVVTNKNSTHETGNHLEHKWFSHVTRSKWDLKAVWHVLMSCLKICFQHF